MNCLKCGRETVSEQVFCEDCLLEMQKYPVKPGTVVLLPRRREHSAAKKTAKRRGSSPEEQVKQLKKRVRYQSILILVCFVLMLAMLYPTLHYLRDDHVKMGQNYSVVTQTVPTAPTEAER